MLKWIIPIIGIWYCMCAVCLVTQSCPTLGDPMDCSMPGLPVHHQLLEFTQTHVHWVSDAIQPSHPLLSPSLPAPNLSQHQGLFKWVSPSHQVAEVLEFQLQHQRPSNEHPGLISWVHLRMDWLDLLAVQGTLKSLLQHQFKSVNSSASAFFTVQLSHPYMTIGKTIALTRRIFVGKVMSLLFNMLSSTLAWKIPWTEGPVRLQSMWSLKVRHDWVTSLSLFTFMNWRRNWQPTPVFLPGESQGRGSLLGCHLWCSTESETTEVT